MDLIALGGILIVYCLLMVGDDDNDDDDLCMQILQSEI